MKTTYAATLAIALAALGTTHAIAADATSRITNEQVTAELIEAQRTGDIYDGHHNMMLNEMSPQKYPAKVKVPGPTRAQVLAELEEAQRTGDMYDARCGTKLNEINPGAYPKKS